MAGLLIRGDNTQGLCLNKVSEQRHRAGSLLGGDAKAPDDVYQAREQHQISRRAGWLCKQPVHVSVLH